DPLTQRTPAFSCAVLKRGQALIGEDIRMRLSDFSDGEELGSWQSTGERNDLRLFGDFQNFADGRDRHSGHAAREVVAERGQGGRVQRYEPITFDRSVVRSHSFLRLFWDDLFLFPVGRLLATRRWIEDRSRFDVRAFLYRRSDDGGEGSGHSGNMTQQIRYQ